LEDGEADSDGVRSDLQGGGGCRHFLSWIFVIATLFQVLRTDEHPYTKSNLLGTTYCQAEVSYETVPAPDCPGPERQLEDYEALER